MVSACEGTQANNTECRQKSDRTRANSRDVLSIDKVFVFLQTDHSLDGDLLLLALLNKKCQQSLLSRGVQAATRNTSIVRKNTADGSIKHKMQIISNIRNRRGPGMNYAQICPTPDTCNGRICSQT